MLFIELYLRTLTHSLLSLCQYFFGLGYSYNFFAIIFDGFDAVEIIYF